MTENSVLLVLSNPVEGHEDAYNGRLQRVPMPSASSDFIGASS